MIKLPKYFFAILFLTLGLTSCSNQGTIPGRAFEGKITQVVKVPGIAMLAKIRSGDTSINTEGSDQLGGILGAAANLTIVMYAREDRVAYDVSALGGLAKARSIVNRGSRTLTMLLPGNNAVVTNLRSVMDTLKDKLNDSIKEHHAQLDSIAEVLPKPTGKKMTIKNMEAEEYIGKYQGMDVRMWITQDPRMKFYDIMRDAFLGRVRTGESGIEEAFDLFAPLAGNGKFPLKVEMTFNGKPILSSEVTDIEEEKVEDSIFEIPSGYKITNTEEMSKKH